MGKNDYNILVIFVVLKGWSDYMSKTEIFQELYKLCKEMDIEDTMELVLNADISYGTMICLLSITIYVI